MTWFQKLGVGLAALVLVATAAAAQEARSPFQSGLYVGVHGGPEVGSSALDLNIPAGSILNLDGLSSNGYSCGVHGGLDYRLPNSKFLIGVVGKYQFCETELDVSSGVAGVNLLNATIEPTWGVGARVGYANGPWLFYGGYMWANAELTVTSGLAPGSSLKRDLQGHNPFVGIELAAFKFGTVGVQYDYTKFKTEELLQGALGPATNLDLDTETHAFTLRVNARLEGLIGE